MLFYAFFVRFSVFSQTSFDEDEIIDPSMSDPYLRLKSKLFSLIIEHRIFREKAILKLFDKAAEINSHMDRWRLQQIFNEVRTN